MMKTYVKIWLASNHPYIFDEFFTLNGHFSWLRSWQPNGSYRRMWRMHVRL
jgi:hypothetical protein